MNLKTSILLIVLLSFNLSLLTYTMEEDVDAEIGQKSTELLDLPNELIIRFNNLLMPLPNASAEQIIECFEDLLAFSQSSKGLHELLKNEMINHIQKNIDHYGSITNFNNDNLLSLALKEKRYKVASLFYESSLATKFEWEKLDPNEMKMFFAWAITNGRLDIAELCSVFIPKTAVNMQDKNSKNTLLHLAAKNSDENCVQFILEKGANVDSKDDNNNIPLDWAVRRGHLDIVKLLVAYGSNVNSQNKLRYYTATPLKVAVIYGKKEVMEFLLDNGAEIESDSIDDFSPIEVALLASYDNDRNEIITSLLSHGAKKTTIKNIIDQDRALFFAAQMNYPKAIKILLQEGADIEAKSSSGLTPLLIATIGGNNAAVKLLIDLGADLFCKSNVGNSILLISINKKDFELCQLFVKYKELIHEPDKELNLPFHYACLCGNFKIIKLLIDSKADVNALDSNSLSPLAATITYDKLPAKVEFRVIKYLLKKGALVNFASRETGISPLFAAVQHNKPHIVNLLINHGADINAALKDSKKTALDIAKENGSTEIINILTEAKKRGRRYNH